MQIMLSRRRFLASATLAAAAGLVATPESSAAEAPLETTTIRLVKNRGICLAPQYVAEELLHLEGFTDVRYVQGDPDIDQAVWIARGETDFSINYAPVHVASIDAGVPIKVLGGLHSGCLELIANDSVEGISDLKGKRVGIHDPDAP
ncbi:MAG: ABC transporter substrate-binding protein, partial [Mesorhizobium sp.]